MNRKRNILFLIMVMILSLFSPWEAEAGIIPEDRLMPRLVDEADILTDTDETLLLAKLDEISERQQCDVAVVTVQSLDGKSSQAYADDYYDYNGYGMGEGDDGILLLISMEARDWAITTYGSAIPAFTDAGQSYMVDRFRPLLSEGDYAQAFETFADLCDEFLTQAATGSPYDSGNLPRGKFPLLNRIVMALGIGILIAFVVVSYMKSQLKSVEKQMAASAYAKQGSMHITDRSDFFLYRNVTRQKKPQQSSGSSTHQSSSGRSHGGSSGKF